MPSPPGCPWPTRRSTATSATSTPSSGSPPGPAPPPTPTSTTWSSGGEKYPCPAAPEAGFSRCRPGRRRLSLGPTPRRRTTMGGQRMEPERYQTVVVGGGQAGLATVYHLARLGRPFVILDAGQGGGDARRARWGPPRAVPPRPLHGP